MARARNIKPAIMDNERLAELPFEARLLFVYLWMLADREGRLEDRPKRIAAQALPYDRSTDVGAMLDSLHKAGFIERYEAQGVACIQVVNFKKHQTPHVRESASELPASTNLGEAEHQPRPVQAQKRDDTHLAESVRRRVIDRDGGRCLSCGSDADLHVDHIVPRASGGKTEEGNLQTLCRACNQSKGSRNTTDFRKHDLGKAKASPRSPDSLIPDSLIVDSAREALPAGADQPTKRRRAQKTSMPDDFGLSDRVKAWATAKGFDGLDEHLEAFRRKATAHGYTYVNWDDAFMEAVREDWAKLRVRRTGMAADGVGKFV